MKLNKISTRYYWEHFLTRENIPKALFYPVKLSSDEQLALFQTFVCIVNIETSSYCNRKCTYCPVSFNDGRKKQSYMTDKLFDKIIGDLTRINYASTLCLNLYNEPLADKTIYRRIEQIRKCLPYAFLMFNSNGDYVSTENLNSLSQIGLNALFVTLHPSAKKHYYVGDRLKHFNTFFNKIGIAHYKIDEQLENGHIESNVDWCGMRLRVMANDWSKQGNSRAGTVHFLNTSTVRTSPCVRPLREFTISYTGQVFPCCQFFPDDNLNEKYIVGNVAFRSIFEIYTSPTLAMWREALFSFGRKKVPCDSCRDEDFSQTDSAEIRQTIINTIRNKQ